MKIKKYKNISEVVYEETLDNGLKVIVVPKKDYRQVAAYFATKFGALTNTFVPLGEKDYIDVPLGVAHFLEHKLFTEKDGSDASNYFTELALESNAYTTYNHTAYYFNGNKNIEEGIEKLLDFVQEPNFNPEGIEKEKGIIEQEIKMYLDRPAIVLSSAIKNNMFLSNPVKNDVAGSVESIKQINDDILYKCYNTFYHPSNMVFIVCGGVDAEKIIEQVKTNQSKKTFSKKQDIKRKIDVETGEVVKEKGQYKLDITMPKATVALKLPYEKLSKNELVEREILFKICLDSIFGETSENFSYMKNNELITTSFNYGCNLDLYYGYIRFTTDTSKPDEFIEFVKNKLLDFKASDVSEELFMRIKKGFLGEFIFSFNYVDGIAGSILDYYMEDGDYFYNYDIIDKLKLKDLKKFEKYLRKESITSYKIIPNKE